LYKVQIYVVVTVIFTLALYFLATGTVPDVLTAVLLTVFMKVNHLAFCHVLLPLMTVIFSPKLWAEIYEACG
jgi:hypothetical protein